MGCPAYRWTRSGTVYCPFAFVRRFKVASLLGRVPSAAKVGRARLYVGGPAARPIGLTVGRMPIPQPKWRLPADG